MMPSLGALLVAVVTVALLLTRPRAISRLEDMDGSARADAPSKCYVTAGVRAGDFACADARPCTAHMDDAAAYSQDDARAFGARACRARASRSGAGSGMGMAASVAAVAASARAGASPYAAFASLSDGGFAAATLTERRIREVLDACASKDETPAQVAAVASGCMMAASLSGQLGCSLADCLDVVGSDYRRSCMLRDLRRNAFAVPKATASLLMVLPAATLLLGELMGAGPLRFLFASSPGHVCLTLGGFGYVAGTVWMMSMMRGSRGVGGHGDISRGNVISRDIRGRRVSDRDCDGGSSHCVNARTAWDGP